MRKLILYIACSLDEYIAKPNDDLSFLSVVEKEGEDYGYSQFVESVDTVILGRKTYEWVLKHAAFPHSDKQTFVITRTPKPNEGNIHFYSGSLKELVANLKKEKGKYIFCDGGSQVVQALLHEQLIDEVIISIIPIFVGDGTRLFENGRPEQKLTLLSCKHFEKGLVQLHYRCD